MYTFSIGFGSFLACLLPENEHLKVEEQIGKFDEGNINIQSL